MILTYLYCSLLTYIAAYFIWPIKTVIVTITHIKLWNTMVHALVKANVCTICNTNSLTYFYCSLLHLTHQNSHSVCKHQVLFQHYLCSDILHNWHLKWFARKLMKRECITQSEIAVYSFQLYLKRNKCEEIKIGIINDHVHCWK